MDNLIIDVIQCILHQLCPEYRYIYAYIDKKWYRAFMDAKFRIYNYTETILFASSISRSLLEYCVLGDLEKRAYEYNSIINYQRIGGSAIQYDRADVIEWIMDNKRILSMEVARYATEKNNIKVLKYFITEQKIHPLDIYGLFRSSLLLDAELSRNYLGNHIEVKVISLTLIDDTILTGNLNSLKYLCEYKNCKDYKSYLKTATYFNKDNIITWLSERI